MAEQNFDNFFKEKLQSHESAVPAGLWEKIEAEQGKKRRGIFWWKNSVIIALLLATISAGVWFTLSNQNGKEQNAEFVANSSDENEAHGKNILSNEKNAAQKILSKTEKNTIAENEPTSEIAKKDKNPESNSNQQAKITDAGLTTQSTRIINHFGKKGIAQTNFKNSTIISINKIGKNKNISQHGLENNPELLDNEMDNGKENSQSERQSIKDALSLLAKSDKNLSNTTISKELLNNLKFKGIQDCPSALTPARNDWYVELFASPDYASKSSGNRNASENYLNAKNNSESFQGAFTAGARISKNIGNNLMVKSGLQYSQINEKFKYQSESERKLITVVTIRNIIRGPGDTLMVRDTSIVEQIGYKVRTTFNKYRSIDIPVLLGYEWGNLNWKTSVQAGVILNVRSWQQGEILDTSLTPLSFNKGSSSIFKQNIGLGLYAGFSVLRSLNNRAEIFAEPYIRYNLSNMASGKSPYNQKFTITGINFGVRYKLNDKNRHN